MIAALTWAATRHGTSDLLRFWGVRWDDLSIHELVCCWDTVPSSSATALVDMEKPVGLTDRLLALIIDSIVGLSYGLGGKRMPESSSVLRAITGEKTKEQDARDRVLELALKDKAKYTDNNNNT